MLEECFGNVRLLAPLIHNITNYVTANDVANALLACGAGPIMADEPDEAEDIAAASDGLNINLGTLRRSGIEAMLRAGRKTGALGHPILLDPVGVGVSALRADTARRMMRELGLTLIRGNISEIKVLAYGSGSARGVDAGRADRVTEENLREAVGFVKDFAARTGCVTAVSGAIDLVSDGSACYVIRNGRPEMGKVTGTGCQLSAVMTACAAANPGNTLEAAAAAVCAMGLAGEIGWSRMREGDGNVSYRGRIIDALYNMDTETLRKGARYELR